MVSRNVGLIGLHASGKTTLLTSLIAQLKNHNPARFPIGRDGKARITEFEIPPIEEKDGWSSFRFQRYLSQLSERQRWPEKTTDREKIACQFRHSDDRLGKRTIEFYDIPGERFVDMAMVDRSYKAWSSDTWANINTVTLSEAYAGFIAAVKAGGERPDELVAAYKLGMARTLGLDRAAITPSTFLLDLEGTLASDRSDDGQELPPEQIVAGRHSGLPNAEFVPIPPEFLKRWSPSVVAEFARAYEVYKEQVVRPVFDAIRRCDSLLVMVDVLTLLEYGTGMYSDTTKQMRVGLPGLRPGGGAIRKSIGWAGGALPSTLRLGGVRKIAFVVPKVDMVHPDDRDRLEKLGKDLVDGLIADLKDVKSAFLLCSAIYSSIDPEDIRRPDSGRDRRHGRDGRRPGAGRDDEPDRPDDSDDDDETTFIYYKVRKEVEPKPGQYQRRKRYKEVTEAMEVSRIPDDWHQGLSRGGAYHPPIPPNVSIAENDPPEHYNLDGVFRFLTD
jgi:predicted YcjX-like family ATPase